MKEGRKREKEGNERKKKKKEKRMESQIKELIEWKKERTSRCV